MSFSVDDLVSSLSATHVGQEAIDLALLHAQLSETLLFSAGPSIIPARGRSRNTQPCTTPTARTPSASTSSWGFMDATSEFSRTRANSLSSTYANDMDEDERMVEELLIPSSSSSSSFNSAQLINNTEPFPSSSSPSSFTSTDPFYVAQLQSSNAPPSSPSQSVFAQNARLNPASPFALPSPPPHQYSSSSSSAASPQFHHHHTHNHNHHPHHQQQFHHHHQIHHHHMSMNMNMNMNHNPAYNPTAAAAF